MRSHIKKSLPLQLVTLFFILLTIWWISIYFRGIKTNTENYMFGGIYGTMAFIGGFIGLRVGKKWGYINSLVGKAVVSLAIGLFFQAFGQYVFWYYNFFLKVEVPYPSLADIGYFGSIIWYILGILFLSRASGVQFSLRRVSGQIQAIIIPLLVLIISYTLFLNKHPITLEEPLKTFLDFGYPLGQAIYISIAILAFSLSRKYLGGVMKKKILIIIIAFAIQYLADFSFLLFQEEYYNASFIDYIYLTAYFILILGLDSMNFIHD